MTNIVLFFCKIIFGKGSMSLFFIYVPNSKDHYKKQTKTNKKQTNYILES